MLELTIVRHGETEWNREQRWMGHSDVPLNAAGLAQARLLSHRLRGRRFDRVYASDLGRARTTAAIVLPDHDLRVDSRIREMNFGSLEGHSWEDLGPEERAQLRRWEQDPYNVSLNDTAESFSQVEGRIREWLACLPASGTVAAFTHGCVIRCLLWSFFKHPADGLWSVAVDPTSITRVSMGPEGHTSILTLNDAAHLEASYRECTLASLTLVNGHKPTHE